MRHLFSAREEWYPAWRDRPLSLFLDFDGTLATLCETPQEVRLGDSVKRVLKELVTALQGRVCVVSGRSLEDLRQRVDVAGLTYAGNHGLELEGPWVRFESHVSERMKRALRRVKGELAAEIAGVSGVLLEDKGATLSLHYRLAAVEGVRRLRECVRRIVREPREHGLLTVSSGKKVLEVRPAVPWDKGRIVEWILMRQRAIQKCEDLLPIYVGDDRTDEDAFRAILPDGLAVRVGMSVRSLAPYFVNDVDEVQELLDLLAEAVRGGGS